jgi:hypothetical protein
VEGRRLGPKEEKKPSGGKDKKGAVCLTSCFLLCMGSKHLLSPTILLKSFLI